MSNGRTKYLWILTILLHFLCLSWQVKEKNWFLVDSEDYITASQNLLEHGILYSGEYKERIVYAGNYTRRPPMYPLLLLPVRAWEGAWVWVILMQIGLSLGSLHFFLKTFEKLYPDKEVPYWLWIFLLCYPAQFIYTELIMSEVLFQFFLTSSMYFLFKAVRSSSNSQYLYFALLFTCALLTKPVVYLLVPIVCCYFLYRAWKEAKLVLVWVALIPTLILSLYILRNYQVTRYAHVSSVQNINLLQYQVNYILNREYGAQKSDSLIDAYHEEARLQVTFLDEQRYLSRIVKKTLLEYPEHFVALQFKGVLNFFLDPGRFDLYHFFDLDRGGGAGLMATFGKHGYKGIIDYLSQQPLMILGLLALVLLLNLLKFLAFLLFPFSKKIGQREKWYMWVLVGYIAAVTGVMGASRFAMPISYFLILMLPAGLETFRSLYFKMRSQ